MNPLNNAEALNFQEEEVNDFTEDADTLAEPDHHDSEIAALPALEDVHPKSDATDPEPSEEPHHEEYSENRTPSEENFGEIAENIEHPHYNLIPNVYDCTRHIMTSLMDSVFPSIAEAGESLEIPVETFIEIAFGPDSELMEFVQGSSHD